MPFAEIDGTEEATLERDAAHVFLTDLDRPDLDEADRHHLGRVLRLRAGEVVTGSDGAGGWRRFRVAAAGAEGTRGWRLESETAVVRHPRPSPPLTVAFALTKGERPEWVVQKLTEAGADRIVPFAARRSVTRWDPVRAAKNTARLRQVARQAAMQCRRVWLPAVDEVAVFADVVRGLGPEGAALAQPGGVPPSLEHPTLLVGPEGGWSPEELACGLPLVSLGPHVLRAETAAMAAALLLGSLRSGMVRPA